MSAEKWKWFGHAGHFIGSASCRFHLCTQVGKFLISTVGDYFPQSGSADPERETLGAGEDSFFETYIFTVESDMKCADPACGCGLPNINLSEVEGYRTATAGEAATMHMKMCRKYAKVKP